VLPEEMEGGGRWPRISIVTPSYNQGGFIEQAIRSVLLQGYPNLEYFVVDGGSTDGAVEVIGRYERWITWWVSEADRGQSHAINKGFARATGEIFAWLNSDDYYLPGALEAVGRTWRSGQSPAVLVGKCMSVSPDGRILSRGGKKHLDFDHVFFWDANCLDQPACFFPAESYRALGGLDESLYLTMDMDLWLKLLKAVPFRYLDAYLAAAHRHPKAKTQYAGRDMYVEICLVQLRHGGMRAAEAHLGRLCDKFDVLSRKVRPFVENPLYRTIRPVLVRFLWKGRG